MFDGGGTPGGVSWDRIAIGTGAGRRFPVSFCQFGRASAAGSRDSPQMMQQQDNERDETGFPDFVPLFYDLAAAAGQCMKGRDATPRRNLLMTS
ncbi:hypothetical protein AAGT95_07690 [Salinicola lusitanus]|uniref:Uncharacterized protein n=1 Tax=Salinicola lusitanus TaxID=1949085 RepID=A0ABZ3CXH6_9GAMM